MTERTVEYDGFNLTIDSDYNIYLNGSVLSEFYTSGRVHIYLPGYKSIAKYRIIAKAFPEICGEWFDGCEVHHLKALKEGGTDEPNNLIVLTKEEHTKIHQGYTLNKKPVKMLDWYGNVIKVFSSKGEAALKSGIPTAYITRIMRMKHKPVFKHPKQVKKKEYYKYNWKAV